MGEGLGVDAATAMVEERGLGGSARWWKLVRALFGGRELRGEKSRDRGGMG